MIIKFLRILFKGSPCYLRINRDRVSIRNVSTDHSIEVTPKLGLDGSDIVLSVGDPVDPASVRVLKPFEHPRLLIADFTGAEKIIQYAVRKFFAAGFFRPSPVVVVHPDLELDGGLAQIEARALREIVASAGARRVCLHYGRQLSNDEVRDIASGNLEEKF